MQRRAEYCASKAEEAGAEDIYFRTRGKTMRIALVFALGNLYHLTFDTVRERGLRRRTKNRWNPDCALATRLKSRFSDSTCLAEASFPDGPVPAAVRRHYRAWRMGIDSTAEESEVQRRERRNRSKIGREERIEIEERERSRAEIRITGTAARLEMRSQARGERRKEAKAPRTGRR